jgi:hypothetical protein
MLIRRQLDGVIGESSQYRTLRATKDTFLPLISIWHPVFAMKGGFFAALDQNVAQSLGAQPYDEVLLFA